MIIVSGSGVLLLNSSEPCIKIIIAALAGVAYWIEHWPADWKVTGSIPSQGTCLGCRPGPWLGVYERQLVSINVFLPLFLPPFSSL